MERDVVEAYRSTDLNHWLDQTNKRYGAVATLRRLQMIREALEAERVSPGATDLLHRLRADFAGDQKTEGQSEAAIREAMAALVIGYRDNSAFWNGILDVIPKEGGQNG